jgi:REP element-mobilizing transposase RayT
MPRLPRTVFANLPHHVTQRGNRREDIFFTVEVVKRTYRGLRNTVASTNSKYSPIA